MADEVQLCVQALCLEEILGVTIASGALFYGETRRRSNVAFDAELRSLTEDIAAKVHELLRLGETPPPVFTKGCRGCSLFETCRPENVGGRDSTRRWIRNMLEGAGV